VILEGMAADTADASQLRRAQALLWLDDEEGSITCFLQMILVKSAT
jgi:hypothetical protein